MGKIVNFFKVIRNNWKKSTLGAGLLLYGADYARDSYNISLLMRAYCQEAVSFGDEPFEMGKLRRITVILNPAANKKKAKKMFEEYCAPILNLSGVFVSVLETEKEGHAKELIDKIDPTTDAIVVAGGDGTFSETITGLMRTRGELCKIPLGVLPLGKRNSLATTLFNEPEQHPVATIASATLAVVRGNVKPIDSFRVEVLDTGDEQSATPRPVYGVEGIEWGLRRELKKKSDALWWLGPLKELASLVFHGSNFHIAQDLGFIEARVRYTPPCEGCNSCFEQRADLKGATVSQPSSRWWNIMSLQNRRSVNQNTELQKDYSKVVNESCSLVEEEHVVTSDFNLTTNNFVKSAEDASKILVKIGPAVKYQGDLLFEGYKILKNDDSSLSGQLEAKQIEIWPMDSRHVSKELEQVSEEECISIDHEDFEVRPIRVSILPNSIKVFCK